MKKLIVAVMLFALSVPGLASALTYYSPTAAQMSTWTGLVGSSSRNDLFVEQFGNAVKLDGHVFGITTEPSQGYEWIGQNFAALDLSSFDFFALHVYNNNENPWNYSLFFLDNMGSVAVSSPFPAPVANQHGANLSIDLNQMEAKGVDISNVTQLGLLIEATVPMTGWDRNFETIVAPVPEPGTMMLLGAGFLGLAIYGKRRKNA